MVGDPDLSKDIKFCFAPLPHARTEAEFVGRSVQVTPLIGPKASLASVKSWLDAHAAKATFLYFATHGMADGVNPMDESFLAASGAHFYGRDIRSLRLGSNPLVVMSACQSGLGKVFGGGVFGLARAWHSAGAPQVVMSLWNVDDLATKLLMQDFVARVTEGAPAEFALQEAMKVTRSRLPRRQPRCPTRRCGRALPCSGCRPSIEDPTLGASNRTGGQLAASRRSAPRQGPVWVKSTPAGWYARTSATPSTSEDPK